MNNRLRLLTILFLSGFLIAPDLAGAAEAVDPSFKEDLEASASDAAEAGQKDAARGWTFGDGWNLGTSIRLTQTYDTNINLERKGYENDEIYFGIAPTLRLQRTAAEGWVDLAYTPSYNPYLDRDEQSHFGHSFDTNIRLDRNRARLLIRDNFRRSHERASSEQEERRDLRQNTFSPELIYRLTDKVSVSGIYQNTLLQYVQSGLRRNSYMTHEPGGRVYYKLTDKTDIFIDARAIVTDYFNSGLYDSDGFRVAGGVQGRLTDKIRLKFLGGHKTRKYENPSLDSWRGFFVEGTAVYDWTDKTTLHLSVKRDINESLVLNNPFYEYYRAELGFDHQLFAKISLRGSIGYQKNEYPKIFTVGSVIPNVSGERADDIGTARLGVNWKPYDSWNLGVDYGFECRDSSLDSFFNYIDHSVTTSAEYSF